MSAVRDTAADRLALHARDVHFDWTDLPLQWIPGEPFAALTLNVLHLLLPESERWFVQVFSEALPLITDDHLRVDVLGFIGQEGIPAWTPPAPIRGSSICCGRHGAEEVEHRSADYGVLCHLDGRALRARAGSGVGGAARARAGGGRV